MKKLLFVFCFMLATAACTGNAVKTEIANDSIVIEEVDTLVVDTVTVDTISVD